MLTIYGGNSIYDNYVSAEEVITEENIIKGTTSAQITLNITIVNKTSPEYLSSLEINK